MKLNESDALSESNFRRCVMRMKSMAGLLTVWFITAVVFMSINLTCAVANPVEQLKLNGKWTIQQINSNGAAYRGTWIIFQKGYEISGTAQWQNHTDGSIKGIIKENSLELSISYADGLKGFYKAIIADGCLRLINGTSTSNRGKDTATWVADRLSTVTGKWQIKQQNANGARFQGNWVISQEGSDVSGTANWENHASGRIQGQIKGDNMDLTIFYPDGLKGFYKGKLHSACIRIINGTSTSNRGSDSATWTAEGKED